MEALIIILISMLILGFSAFAIHSPDSARRKKILLEAKKSRTLGPDEFQELKRISSASVPDDYDRYLSTEAAERECKQSERLKEIELERSERDADTEREQLRDLPKLSVLVSAKIAQEVVAQFEVAKIIDVANLLTPAQAEEGIRDLHEELRPLYEERLLAHFIDTTGIESLEVKHLEKELAQCMAQGLKAVMQLEEVKPLLAQTESEQNSGSRIEKGRSWKDIKEQHD